MKLYTGPTTPFGRKVSVVARELGIPLEEERVVVFEAEFLDAHNPLRQIPVLILDDGTAMYDSRVICEYLDGLSDKPTLYPNADRWAVNTRYALANGLTEASVQLQLQKMLPENEQSATTKARLESRIGRAIDELEREVTELDSGELRIDQITAATALGHVEFRHSKSWRERCPKLAAWFDAFSERPSMVETQPKV